MDSIYFDFSPLHLIERPLPIWTDKERKAGMAACSGESSGEPLP